MFHRPRARWMAFVVLMGVSVGMAGWILRREKAKAAPVETEAHEQVRRAVLHNVSRELVEEVLRLEAQERRVAETVWAKEMLAQECGRTIERLWDEINGATNQLDVRARTAVGEAREEELHRGHGGGGTEGTERGKEGGLLAANTQAVQKEEASFEGRGKLGILARFAFGEVQFGRWDLVEELPHGIRVVRSRENPSHEPSSLGGAREERERRLNDEEWKVWLGERIREGWVLEQVEFRQNRFEVSENGEPVTSRFYFAANLLRAGGGELGSAAGEERVSLEGDLEVSWGAKGEDGLWAVRRVDASKLVMKQRVGEPVFRLAQEEVIVPREQERWIDPLIVYDLDGDGGAEIILAGRNLVFFDSPQRHREHRGEGGGGESYTEDTEGEAQRARRGEVLPQNTLRTQKGEEAGDADLTHQQQSVNGTKEMGKDSSRRPLQGFYRREFCNFPEGFVRAAVLADVTGDGLVDFVCAKWEGVFVFEGAEGGLLPTKAKLAWKAERPIERAMVMSCGDVEGDGDLDIYLGQYKDPYEGGVTPRPFYDANDGYPGYLLVNQGSGVFIDGTAAAGLERKRHRRTFSASLVDLDRDDDLDLMVVSDFAGVDVYANDGAGRFADVTENWVDPKERLGFGMAHDFADFNNDGLMDVLMIGMTSPTLERLNGLGLVRAKDARERELEVAMTYGNRLLFGKGGTSGEGASGKVGGGRFEQSAMSDSIARAGWAWGCASLDFDNDGFADVYIANGFQSQGTVTDSEGDYWLHDRFLESPMGAQATDLYFKSSGARNRGAVRSFGGNERNRFYWNRGGTNFLEVGYLLGVSVGEDSRNVVADDLDGDGRVDLVMTTLEVWPEAKQRLRIYRNVGKEVGDGTGAGVEVYATGGGFRSQGPRKRGKGVKG